MGYLERQLAQPGFWDDSQAAQLVMIEHSEVSSEVNFWRDLENRVGSAIDLLGLAIEEGDNTLEESLANEANA
ncbi:uncharacterized protein METZ01_LOCUS395157, partial [marine metagenome]